MGSECTGIDRRENDWCIQLGDRGTLVIECPWQIISAGRIAHADTDEGQKFGLPEPVDGVARTSGFLSGKKIIAVETGPTTGDLKIQFEGETLLECWNNSSGYEGWHPGNSIAA